MSSNADCAGHAMVRLICVVVMEVWKSKDW